MSPHFSIPTSMTPDSKKTRKAGAACEGTQTRVFATSDTFINPVGNNSEPNHRSVNKPVNTVPRPELLKVMRRSRKIKCKDTRHLHSRAAKTPSSHTTHAARDDKVIIIREVSHATDAMDT